MAVHSLLRSGGEPIAFVIGQTFHSPLATTKYTAVDASTNEIVMLAKKPYPVNEVQLQFRRMELMRAFCSIHLF